jgi:hypothetical protein
MTDLDPAFELKIRELATLTARVTALEVIGSEIKPELKRLAQPNWQLILTMGSAFFLVITFVVGMEETLRSSNSQRNADNIAHLEIHQAMMEADHKTLAQKYAELLEQHTNKHETEFKDIRENMWTRSMHNIFDAGYIREFEKIDERLKYLERKTK